MLHQEEHTDQIALLLRCARYAATYPVLGEYYSIPNGGKRHPRVAQAMKDEGLQPGMNDLVWPVPMPRPANDPAPAHTPPGWYCSFYLELKKEKGGVVSPAQRKVHT